MSITLTDHNWTLRGHDWAVNHLRKGIANGRTRHAYLFAGIDGVGKRTLAYNFAMALNAPHPHEPGNIDYDSRAAKRTMSGNHPDIVLSFLDEKTGALKIEQVREVSSKLALRPFEAKYRIAILDDFQNARPQAQDALLKTLEEPAETSLLLLMASGTEGILSTITSRCQIINLRPVPVDMVRRTLEQEHHVPPPDADLIARVSGGRIGWAIAACEPDSPILRARDEALALLEQVLTQTRIGRFDVADKLGRDKLGVLPILELWMTYWRDVLMVANGVVFDITNVDRQENIRDVAALAGSDGAESALKATRNTLGTLRTTNTNARLALEVMLLDYPGL
ncbi:MAG: DNA polymerase III subunit [Chloroflexota bacterium]